MGLGDDIADAILGPVIGFFDQIGNGIRSIFDGIMKIFKHVEDIPSSIQYVIDFFKCPLNILNNIETCISNYLTDVLLLILYYILIVVPFGIFYCVIIAPTIFILNMFLPLVGLGRITLTFSDLCPFKNTFGKYLEFVIYKINNKNYFLRKENDIKNCYCTSGIEGVMNPLRDVFSPESSTGSGSGTIQLFVFAIIITGILFIPGNKTNNHIVSVSQPVEP